MGIKIQIGKTPTEKSVREQIEDAGFSFGVGPDGSPRMDVKFPGVDTMSLSLDEIVSIRGTLGRLCAEGDSPAAAFSRSASFDENGNMTGKFSDKARSRSVGFTPDDQVEVAALLGELCDKWGDWVAQLEAAKAAAEDSKDPK